MDLVYGSQNNEKLVESRRVASDFGVKLIGLMEAAGGLRPPDLSEPEPDYEGNARRKAQGYAEWLMRPCLADDTGIEIEELNWLPGVYTARFGFDTVKRLLIPDRSYAARFVCCVAYAETSGRSVSVTTSLTGTIVLPSHSNLPDSKLPYSFLFTPEGEQRVLATIMREDPRFLSHRGRAVSALLRALL